MIFDKGPVRITTGLERVFDVFLYILLFFCLCRDMFIPTELSFNDKQFVYHPLYTNFSVEQ